MGVSDYRKILFSEGYPYCLLGQSHVNITLPHSFSLSGGFTPCRHLRPSSGREQTIVYLTHSIANLGSYRPM